MSDFTAEEIRILKVLAGGILAGLGTGTTASASTVSAASDADLDSQYGDPTVRKDPKRWAGASYVGAKYSECPSDYLLVLAESFEYFAAKDQQNPDCRKHRNGTPFWKYNLIDAGRAKGWARRNKGLVKPPPAQVVEDDDGAPPEEYGDSNVDEGAPF